MQEKPSKIRASVISGVLIGFVWAVPGLNLINCCCCAGIILGGVLAVYLYKQEFTADMQPLESSDAVILGIIVGVIAAFTSLVLNLLIFALFGDIAGEFARSMLDAVLERMANNGSIPPETIDQMKSEFENSLSQSRSVTGVMMDLVFNLIINPLFAMAGAMIGFSIFKPKKIIDDTPQREGQA